MKHHLIKALLSALLALALLLGGLAVPASAAETDTPVIFLGGFGMELYLNEGTPEQTGLPAGALGGDAVLAALKETLLYPLRNPLAAIFSPNHLADILATFMMSWLGLLACDENGDSVYPLTNDSDGGFYGYVGGRKAYEFNYDWRLDPVATAWDLHDYIQQVKKETGKDKVNLYALSFGTVVICAYLAECGKFGDVESVFLSASAHGGLQLAEDLIQKKLAVSAKGFAPFLAQMMPANAGLFATLDKLCVFRLLEWPVNLMLKCIKNRFYEKAVIPLLGQMPAAWAFVTDDAVYEAAKASLLSDTTKYAGLIRKIDGYHYGIGNRTNEVLKDAAAKGIKIALVSGYDCAPIPIGGTFLYQSDFMIATKASSGGAVCADYGKTLPAGYAQAKACGGHNHISPDNMIDASACALPEQTWFVKGHMHQYEYGGAGLYRWFLDFDGQPDVRSDERYPQFR
ncbi:MAG: hypothetical protein FWC27_02420 [Firmicutes bacterium]|nr:hypothetical protein [Bacillota bacterium]